MQGNDISNTVVPRIVLVWDGLLGIIPTKAAEAKFGAYMRIKRWKKAVKIFEINEAMARQVWDITYRKNFSVDVVTFLGGEAFGDALRERLDQENLPIGHVWYEDPDQLSRSLAYRPDTACVFHSNPQYWLTFGSKGRLVKDPADPNLIGAL